MDEDYTQMPWRTGDRNNRAIYVQRGAEPDHDNDTFIGTLDTAEIVAEAVNSHNRRLTGT